MTTRKRHIVAEVGEIPPGTTKIVEVEGREIGIVNVGGEYFGIRNRCPHQAGPLCAGPLLRTIDWKPPNTYEAGHRYLMQCPWHGWEFDVRTGNSWFDPNRWKVRRYDVTVTDGESVTRSELRPGPYRAETYPVIAEKSYLVVEI